MAETVRYGDKGELSNSDGPVWGNQVPPLCFSFILMCNYQEGVGDSEGPGTEILFWCPWPPEGHSQNCCFGVPALPEQFLLHVLIMTACPTYLILRTMTPRQP